MLFKISTSETFLFKKKQQQHVIICMRRHVSDNGRECLSRGVAILTLHNPKIKRTFKINTRSIKIDWLLSRQLLQQTALINLTVIYQVYDIRETPFFLAIYFFFSIRLS